MYTTEVELSAALRQFIYSQARQMSRQITRAAEEFGTQSAAQREHGLGRGNDGSPVPMEEAPSELPA